MGAHYLLLFTFEYFLNYYDKIYFYKLLPILFSAIAATMHAPLGSALIH